MLAALAPEQVGPILLAGSPISYWAGVAGKNPMRYSGGLLGGTWMASLAGDLGHGKFDGAYLVNNFENLNPSNTYWSKLYNLYAKVDTEGERFLEFEKWWGGHYLMNKEEMEWIVAEPVRRQQAVQRARSNPSTANTASTCATSARRSSCSPPGATTSRRRSRR